MRHLLYLLLPCTVAGIYAAGFQCGAIGHEIKPTGQRFARSDGTCLAGQHQKRGLEAFFSIMVIALDPRADAKNHGAMTSNQGYKGSFVPAGNETLQQLSVRQT